MKANHSRRIWLIGVGVAVILLAGGAAYALLRTKPGASIEVRAQELKQTIVSSGQVMPPAEVRLDSLLTSTVKAILKREGDPVRAGDVLIQLDDSDIDAARAQAEAALAQARAGKTTLRGTTLPQAREALAQIRASLGESRRELEQQRQLHEAGVTTLDALEKAESAARIYESQEKAALLQIQAGSSGGSASLTAAAAVALAEAQLAAIEVSQDRARVVAPMDGVITSRLVEVGEVVRPGSPLLVLTARGRTRIVIEPDERNLALLAVGQKAAVSAEAYPAESFDAAVDYIAPAVNGDRGTIEVRLAVPNPPPYLRPNMTVSVELEVASRNNAISVPLGAVQDLGGARPWVAVLGNHGKVSSRSVKLGLRGDDAVEVIAGLRPGERVLLEPPPSLAAKAAP